MAPSLEFPRQEEEEAAGFVLNKLYTMKCFAKRDNLRHGRHTELRNMQKGYPPDKRGFVNSACDRMRGKLILIFKSTGEDHVCALNEEDAIAVGLELCNRFRERVGLPPLDRYFEEIKEAAKPKDEEVKPYRKESDKERRTREHFERTKKWMEDQGLA